MQGPLYTFFYVLTCLMLADFETNGKKCGKSIKVSTLIVLMLMFIFRYGGIATAPPGGQQRPLVVAVFLCIDLHTKPSSRPAEN